jgi:hypothetical protein
MPAIQLARLKLQTGKLRDYYQQPQLFIRELRQLLEFYTERSHRSGQSGTPHPLTPAYNVPPPVIRQVITEITPLIKEYPAEACLLADELWEQKHLEFKMLAAAVLGMLPVEPPEPIISRLELWLKTSEEKLLETLVNRGLGRLLKETPQQYFKLIQDWIDSPDWKDQQIALRALLIPAKLESFENLPILFRLLAPLVRASVPGLRPELVAVFKVLAKRSPPETVYFLKQNLYYSDTFWVARQVLRDLPPLEQESLRAALKAAARSD